MNSSLWMLVVFVVGLCVGLIAHWGRAAKDAPTKIRLLEVERETLREQLSMLTNKLLVQEGQQVKAVEEARAIAYRAGSIEALRDFEIQCFPYLSYKESMLGFGGRTEAGYKYQLFVKGAPALESGKVVLSEETKYDEKLRQSAVALLDRATELMTASKLGGIPIKIFPRAETRT